MALTDNCIVVQNRALIPTSCTLSKLASKPINFQSSPHTLFHSKLLLTPLSCVANSSFVSEDVNTQIEIPKPTTYSWSEFARNVSGEWDGFGADFTAQGNPIELPESVVPEAYREWDVRVFDWQTQCPTLALTEELLMTYKTIKLLPTVGCEADAATRYSVDDRNVGDFDNKVSAFAYQSSGCYVAVWPIQDADGVISGIELEHCLINPMDRESRVRIIQVVDVDNGKFKGLKNLRVYCEKWYGPFRNGEQLGGCAISVSAFASTSALQASQVVGAWQGPNTVATFDASEAEFLLEVKENGVKKSVRDDCDLILLPKQMWCSIKESKDGETNCEAGWLFDHGSAVTSTCIFSSDAKLKEIAIARETASLQGV